jgi:GxxExxY protein
MPSKTSAPHEALTYKIIGIAMAVHRRLGPGHKEAIYQKAMEDGLVEAGLGFEPEPNLPVYDGERLLGYYIPDLIVEGKVIVELKAFAELHQKYLGQVITYLNFTRLEIGLLINFGEKSLRPRRVFPSPQAKEFQINHQWLFTPDWLKGQREHDTEHNTDF